MVMEKHSPAAPCGHLLPLSLLLSSFVLLLRLADMRLPLSQDPMEQGFDSLGSSCAYKVNTTHE